jgi:hypothetical protein
MATVSNLERMKTLDDAWNAQNWDVFRQRHSADTAVYWPGQPEPTRGRDAHQAESEEFFKSIQPISTTILTKSCSPPVTGRARSHDGPGA